MKCLTPEQLIAVLYGEGNTETIRQGRSHLQECDTCAQAYWELHDTRQRVQQHDKLETPAPTVVLSQPRSRFSRAATIAAGFILVMVLGWSGFRTHQLEQQLVSMQQDSKQVEQWIQRTENRLDDSNRNQYMLMLGLKDYMDQNFMQRRASYETYQ